jgi:hypothetical protein
MKVMNGDEWDDHDPVHPFHPRIEAPPVDDRLRNPG